MELDNKKTSLSDIIKLLIKIISRNLKMQEHYTPKNKCLLTMTDRKSRYEIIQLIKDKSSKSVNEALSAIIKDYEVKSITVDNGAEFAGLSDVISEDNIYDTHPYCSQERGSNENHNRLIRRHLPKGTKNTTSAEVAKIKLWINRYPKRMFNY